MPGRLSTVPNGFSRFVSLPVAHGWKKRDEILRRFIFGKLGERTWKWKAKFFLLNHKFCLHAVVKFATWLIKNFIYRKHLFCFQSIRWYKECLDFFPWWKNLNFLLLKYFMKFYEIHVKYTTDTYCPILHASKSRYTFKYSVMVSLNMHELRHGSQIGDETGWFRSL